jgi:Protein of unknown function (DUF3987)
MAEAERLGVDPCPIAAHVLAACSSGCSDAWKVKPKYYDDRWTQQPRLWSCVVEDVGARGTEMIRSGFWPIQQRERELRAAWAKKIAEFMERKENGDVEKGEKPPAACERISTSDATVEAACQTLADGHECSKLTVLCDELVTFLGNFGRDDKSAAARALWLESYDRGPKNIDRIMRGNVFVPNWSIVVAGNIQPRKLASMGDGLIDDGLFQRFMTIHTKPSEIVIDDDQR